MNRNRFDYDDDGPIPPDPLTGGYKLEWEDMLYDDGPDVEPRPMLLSYVGDLWFDAKLDETWSDDGINSLEPKLPPEKLVEWRYWFAKFKAAYIEDDKERAKAAAKAGLPYTSPITKPVKVKVPKTKALARTYKKKPGPKPKDKPTKAKRALSEVRAEAGAKGGKATMALLQAGLDKMHHDEGAMSAKEINLVERDLLQRATAEAWKAGGKPRARAIEVSKRCGAVRFQMNEIRIKNGFKVK